MGATDTALGWIVPDWPAPAWVRAGTTTRHGGVSAPPYHSLNLGDHVGDDPKAVAENRRLLRQARRLPSEPVWLNQVHGTEVVDAGALPGATPAIADASYATRPGVVCAVMTADCLPLLLCDREGRRVAAVHAGWRGLAGGVIEAAVLRLCRPGADLLAWLGPAIGPAAFEVGAEVRERFIDLDPQAEAAFAPSPAGRWLADIYLLARLRLARLHVTQVYGGHWCTYGDAERFYSFRRDGATGRMASLIWCEEAMHV